LSLFVRVLALVLVLLPSTGETYDTLKQRAERSYAEQSYARARDLYEQAAKVAPSAEEKRWVEFRLADTLWRSDPAARPKGQAALEDLIRAREKNEETHDRIWAEAHESLGDLAISEKYSPNHVVAQPHYAAALDWWAGQRDLAAARDRYLAIVFRISAHYSASQELLVNALSIATGGARDQARLLLAQQLIREGRPESTERAYEHLEQLIAQGRRGAFYDEALFSYATQLANLGAVVVDDNGNPAYVRDYVKALELYRRLVLEYSPGESRFHSSAKSAIEEITKPVLAVFAASNFLPGSEQQLLLHSRNVPKVELTITPVDLTRDLRPEQANRNLVSSLALGNRSSLRRWTVVPKESSRYAPISEPLLLTPTLEPGAYVIEAAGAGETSRQLVLVSDLAIVTHTLGQRIHAFVTNVMSGEPVAGARVRVTRDQQNGPSAGLDATTGPNGIAEVKSAEPGYGRIIVSAVSGNRQAYDMTWSYGYGDPSDRREWRVYAFTDRTAYRPGETVRWKIIARTREKGEREWTTPAGATIQWQINGPRAEKAASGEVKLNAFGSFWGELPVTPAMALGSYVIHFMRPTGDDRTIGYAELFSLEEYKLPEMRVSVTTPARRFRLGETIEATVEASYYFGGPVANAAVEVEIRKAPYFRYWAPWHRYAWYYPNEGSYDNYRGDTVERRSLKTDANGRAVVKIETNADATDMRFAIEARVTDASRREVSGSGSVAVTKQRYTVLAHTNHSVLRPGERVEFTFNAADANGQPVQADGTVTVIRSWWDQGGPKRVAGYQQTEVATTKISTDAKGDATYAFTPSRPGYYIAKWTSEDRDPKARLRARDLVTAETGLWVSDRTTNEIGYHAAGLDLILDRDTYHIGETAAVMIVTPASGRWVVLTTSTNAIEETQVVHLDGTVKFLQIPVGPRHSPRFNIQACSIFDRTLSMAQKSLIVPRIEQFVQVEVQDDRATYEPRQKGTVSVTTRDQAGKPVAAEVALSVTDQSVTAIRGEIAGDPRAFFYDAPYVSPVIVTASTQSQRYARLARDEKGAIVDEDQLAANEVGKKERPGVYFDFDSMEEMRVRGGVEGGVVGDMLSPPAPRQSAPSSADPWSILQAAPSRMVDAITVDGVNTTDVGDDAAVVVVRSDFRSTAFWKPDVVTGADGQATIELDYPEALTTWKATARAATAGGQFGIGSTTATTRMPLIVRLQGPRFFVIGDRATISAVMNNNTAEAMRVAPSLDVEGVTVTGGGMAVVDVPANGEARVDWTVAAEHAGTAKLRVTGRGAKHGDAMEKSFPVYEHGVDKLVARSGKLRGSEAVVKLDLPAERRATELTVQIAPSLAVTMLDALPYLIDYPYGCTEQTMSRFLPAAIVARTLAKSGLDPKDVEGRIFGGIEPVSAAATHPKRKRNLGQLEAITSASMARLYDFQHGDGGWGWWKLGDSDPYMTAYVVWGLSVAKEGELKVDEEAVGRALNYLDGILSRKDIDPQQETWILHAVAAWSSAAHTKVRSLIVTRAFDDAWTHRDKLTAYSRALLTLAAHDLGDTERAEVLVRNLENGVKIDRTPDQSVLIRGGSSAAETMATAHWGNDDFWWRWYEGPVETTSFALQALIAVDPKNPLVEPVMNWLVKNRRGAQWNNTRDTAIALLSLNDYLRASGELQGGVGYELSVNGHAVASRTVSSAEILGAPSRFAIDPAFVRNGTNEIRIRRTSGGEAPLYFSAEGRFVSLEEPVKAAGHEIFVRREYFKLVAMPTLLKGVEYDRQPLPDGGTVASGERVEVVVKVETKNDYDYLLLEDLKPAGFEAIALQSGGPLSATKDGGGYAYVYQELRDRKVAMFIDHLAQGIWEIHYTLRAEVPGSFHALPLLGQAMYVPEVRANGEEARVTVSAGQ
jgi:uncharacterized protein YfaS (alpha-2-macroglobulin family)